MVAIPKHNIALLVSTDNRWIVGVYSGEENGDIGLEGIALYSTADGKLKPWTGHKHEPFFAASAYFPKHAISMYGSAAQWLINLYCKSVFAPDYVKG